MLATKGQELTCKRNGSFRCIVSLVNVLPMGFVCVQLCQRHFTISGNHAQNIVKIVGDPGGEPSNTLHLAFLKELVFDPLALRNFGGKCLVYLTQFGSAFLDSSVQVGH